MKSSLRALLVIVAIIGILASACKPKAEPIKPDEDTETSTTGENGPIGESAQENKFTCSLTGMAVTDEAEIKYRPIAVMLDNEISARPQSGLSEADIIYEMPVEGNITRYMAIYHHISSEKIGPVRSARPYFIDKALEFGSIYVHCGGSPQALSDIKTLKVDAYNDLTGTPVFWRSTDRKMPHNLYTNTRMMREVSLNKKLENKTAPQYFNFNDDFVIPDGGDGQKIVINYDKRYKVSYIYNKEEKVYYRQINGDNMKDKESKQDIKATNIIVERAGVKVLDKVGRLEIKNIGKNRVYLLTGGKLIEIEWDKSSRSGKTIYKNVKGEEILINKGITWIQVVPEYVKIEFGE